MKLGLLARQVAECLSLILACAIVVYALVYPFGLAHNTGLLASYYTGVFGAAIMVTWLYFGVPRLLGRQCGNCNSKNVFFSFSRGGFCGNCGSAVKSGTPMDDNQVLNFVTKFIAIPSLFFGVCGLLGNALADIPIDFNSLRFSIHLSVWFPTCVVLVTGLAKLFFFKTKYFREHSGLGFTLYFMTLIPSMILTLIIFDAVIFYLLHWLFP